MTEATPRPWLSIGVPTFNRCQFLVKLLDSIDRAWAAAKWPSGALEVVVVDNASADETWPLVQERRQSAQYSLRYLRNDKNIGVLPNFLRAMEESTGDYLMVFGDDDELEPEALTTIRAKVETHPEVASFCFWSRDLAGQDWVREDRRMSMEELARTYFYYPGNCGLAAIHGPAARSAIGELRRRGEKPTPWVITDVFGIAARQRGTGQSVMLSPDPVVRYPNHQSNITWISHYAFGATWLGQTRCAQLIDRITGSELAPLVAKSQLWGREGLKKLGIIFIYAHLLGDLEQDRQETLSEGAAALPTLPFWGRPFCAGMMALLMLPLWLKKGLLWLGLALRSGRSGIRRYHELMQQREAALSRRSEKLRSGSSAVGIYTKSAW